MSSLAAHALDLQLDLQRFYESDLGRRYAMSLGKSRTSLAGTPPRDDHQMAVIHRVGLSSENTYGVSADICDLLEAAAPTVPGYSLHASDLPSRDGFAVLERPLVVPDSFGKPLVVKALSWSQAVIDDAINHDTIEIRFDDDDQPSTAKPMVTTLGTASESERHTARRRHCGA